MEPRAATGEPALRVGHDLPVYVSEAAQLRLPDAPPGSRRRCARGSGPPDDVGVLALERLVGVEPAVARAGQRGVRAAAPVGEDRAAAPAELLLLA